MRFFQHSIEPLAKDRFKTVWEPFADRMREFVETVRPVQQMRLCGLAAVEGILEIVALPVKEDLALKAEVASMTKGLGGG